MIPFDQHPAIEALTEAFAAMDQHAIRHAMGVLRGAARSAEDRETLGRMGREMLLELARIDLQALPEGTDVVALNAWITGVAEDLMQGGAVLLTNEDRPGTRDGVVNGPQATGLEASPFAVAVAQGNWPLATFFIEQTIRPLLEPW